MATIVNLNLGGADSGTGEQVYTADLVLTNGYSEPSPRLLVLQSTPAVAPITGTLDAASAADVASISGTLSGSTDALTGTLTAISQNDTSSFSSTATYPAITGELDATSAGDVASVSGENVGLTPRVGYSVAVSADDTATFEGTYTPKMVAVMVAVSQDDTGTAEGAFYPYEGPGYLVSDGRADLATFEGTNIYDVSGTFAVIDQPDIAAWAVKTRLILEADPLTDTLLVSEELIGDTSGTSLIDYVLVTDVLDEVLDGDFLDTLVVAESLTAAMRVSYPLTDIIEVTDGLYGLTFGIAADVVLVADTLEDVQLPQSLSDTLVDSDSLASYSEITGILADIGVVRDALDAIAVAPVADTLAVTDGLESRLDQYPAALADGVTLTDDLVSPITVYADLSDAIGTTDALLSQLTLVGVLADTVLVGDSLHEAAQTVYVINAETGAVSTYMFTPVITSMTSYQGVLYLAGPAGLYALDAAQDDDGDVVWTLRTGFSNLGTDKLKRVHDCNFQARTEGDTTFQVVSDRYGQKQEWNYRLPPLTRDSYRDGVVKVGRGIQSVYWQFAAHGIGPAEIDQLRLIVEPLSRRR